MFDEGLKPMLILPLVLFSTFTIHHGTEYYLHVCVVFTLNDSPSALLLDWFGQDQAGLLSVSLHYS